MFTLNQYELIDFGAGRRLERFGGLRLDRPCPAAEGTRSDPEAWQDVDAQFERTGDDEGRWSCHRPLPSRTFNHERQSSGLVRQPQVS